MLAMPARRLMVTAARRGILGGSRPWLAVLVLLLGGRVVALLSGWRGWSFAVSQRLEVGDRIEIISLPPLKMGR